MRKSKIPTIIGIVILVIGLAAGVVLVQFQQIFRLGATGDYAPKDVRISNVSDTSFTVSWVTDREALGFIQWSERENNLNRIEKDQIGAPGFIHMVSLRGLRPQTTYYFRINSGGRAFDNNGTVWKVTTGPQIPEPARQVLISGSVLTQTGAPAGDTLVYISVSGTLVSTITSRSGTWVIPVSSARTPDLAGYVLIDDASTLLEISAQASPEAVAVAQIYPQSAAPVPPIVLGQVHDFRNLPPSVPQDIPKASVELPDLEAPPSGFSISEETATTTPANVTLLSHKEGEVISTTKPGFFGEGPPGITITITVESDPITTQVSIPSSGTWSWNPTRDLAEGIHKITISWRDSNGILRTLSRTFIVQASDDPAFETTPSATTATPTPTPTPVPTITPSPIESPTPTPLPVSEETEIPDAGSLTPTLLLSIMGLGVIAFGFLLWKQAET